MHGIEFICPVCDSSVTAYESEIGTMVSCPNCSSELLVPDSRDQVESYVARLRPDQIPVTSGSVYAPHDILGMVCYSLGTRGGMGSDFETMKQSFSHKLSANRRNGQISKGSNVGQLVGGVSINASGQLGITGQYAGATFRSDDIEIAFAIAVSQLQFRASYLGANAIVGFRWDVDFDSHANVVSFFGTAYATAIYIPSQ